MALELPLIHPKSPLPPSVDDASSKKPIDRIARAKELACEIEALLEEETGADAFHLRLAKAMTRSLIDQLEEAI